MEEKNYCIYVKRIGLAKGRRCGKRCKGEFCSEHKNSTNKYITNGNPTEHINKAMLIYNLKNRKF